MSTRPCVPSRAGAFAEPTEDETVRAAQRDPAAFAPLYARYQPQVYRYLRVRVPTAEEAADLTQTVFLRALAALPSYQQRGLPFAAWLFRIARNTATDAHRRRHQATPWDGAPVATVAAPGDDPEAAALRADAVARLRAVVQQLPAAQRELLALRFAGELSVGEIAQALGKSEAAIRKRLGRTLRRIEEMYDDV